LTLALRDATFDENVFIRSPFAADRVPPAAAGAGTREPA